MIGTMPRERPATSFPKDRIKVLLLEKIHGGARALFEREQFQVELLSHALSEAELLERIEDVHVLGVRSKTHVTRRVLERARRLLSLGCFCIGTNQVDLSAANELGIPVFNAPFSNTRSVAELVIAEVVLLARRLFDRVREMHLGTWNKVAASCYEVRGKTLGIVGYGHIGSQVGVLAEALGMRVVFFDIASKLPMGNNRSLSSLGEVLAESDFVTLHVPATPLTAGMIGGPELERMRPGSALINLSRGNVVNIDALAGALRSQHLAGASVDVFPEEPETNGPGFESPLRGLDNVILTPHIGGSTEEAQAAIGLEVATALARFVNSGITTQAVNFPQVEAAPLEGAHRILNVHRNVPGVLGDINRIVSELRANIRAQVLATDAQIGYLVMDLDHDVSGEVHRAIGQLDANIRTRILY